MAWTIGPSWTISFLNRETADGSLLKHPRLSKQVVLLRCTTLEF